MYHDLAFAEIGRTDRTKLGFAGKMSRELRLKSPKTSGNFWVAAKVGLMGRAAMVEVISNQPMKDDMTSLRQAQAPSERRTHPRHEVNYRGVVRFADGTSLPCRVKNISAMGALLEFSEARIMPANFKLTIPDELFSAECEFRHQTGQSIGVLFTTGRMEARARFG